MRFLCRDAIAAHDQLHGLGLSDQPRQSLRAAIAGDDAQVDLRLAELGVLAGEAHVTGHGQLAAATQGKTVHGRDHRLSEALDGIEDALPAFGKDPTRIGVLPVELGDIGASREGLFAAARDHHGMDGGVGLQVGEDGLEGLEHVGVQGIELVGTVEGDDGMAALAFEEHDAHGWSLGSWVNDVAKLRSRGVDGSVCILPRWVTVRTGLNCRLGVSTFLRRYRSILLLVLALLIGTGLDTTSEVQARQRGKRSATVKKRSSGTSKKSTRSRSRRSRRVRVRTTPMTELNVVHDRELSPGVRYTEYRSNGSVPVNVHVVMMDRTVTANAIRIVKGEDRNDGLERIKDMAARYEQQTSNDLLALVNANFWRAYRSTPIGPCVVDGEVVEMLPYKQWSSAFFDNDNAVTIDTFRLSGAIRIGGQTLPIQSVNRRTDSTGICVYNKFAGDVIPYVNAKELEKEFQEALKDTVFITGDSTEDALSREQLRVEIARAQREANVEFPLTKVRLRYLRSPSVNAPIVCQVLGVDTGAVNMPLRGCIVSFPKGALTTRPKAGDTVLMQFKTNIRPQTRFMNAVCGTPRLVRNGVAKHEAELEGSTGRRFIQQNLARTALGTDRSGNKVIIATVEPSQTSDGVMGASLKQLADVMKLLGAYQAMNLDGGGSTGMVVQDDHVFFDGEDPPTRRIAVGIGVVKRSHVLRRAPAGTRTN